MDAHHFKIEHHPKGPRVFDRCFVVEFRGLPDAKIEIGFQRQLAGQVDRRIRDKRGRNDPPVRNANIARVELAIPAM